MATPNKLFAVLDVSSPSTLRERLESLAPWFWLELQQPGQYLVVAPSSVTSKELSEKLGFAVPGGDTGIVVRVESFFGRDNPSIWEWISAKQGAEIGTSASV